MTFEKDPTLFAKHRSVGPCPIMRSASGIMTFAGASCGLREELESVLGGGSQGRIAQD